LSRGTLCWEKCTLTTGDTLERQELSLRWSGTFLCCYATWCTTCSVGRACTLLFSSGWQSLLLCGCYIFSPPLTLFRRLYLDLLGSWMTLWYFSSSPCTLLSSSGRSWRTWVRIFLLESTSEHLDLVNHIDIKIGLGQPSWHQDWTWCQPSQSQDHKLIFPPMFVAISDEIIEKTVAKLLISYSVTLSQKIVRCGDTISFWWLPRSIAHHNSSLCLKIVLVSANNPQCIALGIAMSKKLCTLVVTESISRGGVCFCLCSVMNVLLWPKPSILVKPSLKTAHVILTMWHDEMKWIVIF